MAVTNPVVVPSPATNSSVELPPVSPSPPKDLPDELSPEIPTAIVNATKRLTMMCIMFAMTLCVFVIYCAVFRQASELTVRLLMSCIACFVGLAFASLGFGLFLLRARGAFRARVDAGGAGTPPALLESTAPGLVVIVCATVVMWLALRVKFDVTTTGDGTRHTQFNYTVPTGTLPHAAEQPPSDSLPTPLPHLTDGVKAP